MYVDWEYYKIFYFVAKYRNFTKAARVLGSNQPNITHTMNKLEDQLHCVLFIRSNRGVTLTPEGEMLYTRISSAAVQIQDAEEELSASATFEHGAISISATETALNIYLSERLRDFHAQYPGIRLRISNHSTPQAIQAVKNGEVDFAVVTTPTGAEGELKKVDLMTFNEILVGGKTFTALASRTLSLQELDAYPLIMLGNESMSRLFYRQFFLEHSEDLKPDIEAATTDQMMTLVNEMVRKGSVTRGEYKALLLILSPVTPHVCEEIWQRQGFGTPIYTQPWPAYDPAALVKDEVEIAIQVNGKIKGRIMVPASLTREQGDTLREHEAVKAAVGDKQIVKFIFVPGRLLNIVVK